LSYLDADYVDDDGTDISLRLALDVSIRDRVFLAFLKIPLSFLCDPRNSILFLPFLLRALALMFDLPAED